MKTKLIAMLLMAGSTMFAGVHFAVGVNLGGPVAVAAYRPASPGPGYIWIDGYRDGYGRWINGYWAAPPYAGAYWVGPRYVGGRFVTGYWGGERHVDRDHFDRDHGRRDDRGFRR